MVSKPRAPCRLWSREEPMAGEIAPEGIGEGPRAFVFVFEEEKDETSDTGRVSGRVVFEGRREPLVTVVRVVRAKDAGRARVP